LKYFEYTFGDYFKSIFRECCAKMMKKKNRNLKDYLYKVGINKLNKEFDIVRYFKKIRFAISLGDLLLNDV